MSKSELKKTRELIHEALIESSKKLIAQKKRLGQQLIVSENGVIKTIEP
jgi:hypothetical protein